MAMIIQGERRTRMLGMSVTLTMRVAAAAMGMPV
jgi:hypothetical protein